MRSSRLNSKQKAGMALSASMAARLSIISTKALALARTRSGMYQLSGAHNIAQAVRASQNLDNTCGVCEGVNPDCS
jgi:hypothetical protein